MIAFSRGYIGLLIKFKQSKSPRSQTGIKLLQAWR